MDYKTQFIKNLKDYRKQNNLTQDDLAEMLGYSQKNIAKWEQGFTLPSVDVVVDLAKRMNISLDELLGLNEKSILDQCAEYIIKKLNLNKDEIVTIETDYEIEEKTRGELVYDYGYGLAFGYVDKLLDMKPHIGIDVLKKDNEGKFAVEFLKNNGHIVEDNGEIILSKGLAEEAFEIYEKHLIENFNTSKKSIEEWQQIEKTQKLCKVDRQVYEAEKEFLKMGKAELERFYELKEKYFAKK